MPGTPDFFCVLQRRAQYECKDDGKNYHYSRYRVAIAEDCLRRCVYCDCHEDEIGGHESMEIDHFRPYGRAEFVHLRDVPENLLHACGRCNSYKSDHWPSGDPDRSYNDREGWIDPFHECRADFFEISEDGTLRALKAPAEYVIRLLRLNRELLRRLRQRRRLLADLPQLIVPLEAKWRAVADGTEPGNVQAIAREGVSLIDLIKALQRTGLS
jgi:5-methylcytosine-specific restriction endonuclease McrA